MILIPKFILKNCLRGAPFLILKNFDWLIHYDMEFVFFWKAHFKFKFPLMYGALNS